MIDGEEFVGKYYRYPDKTGGRMAEGGRRLNGLRSESRKEAPLVTVITVCWNSAETIEQAIRSVIGQSYNNIEYIIVDGASSDSTLDIIRKYEADIDYYVSEPDEGLYYAMNKGLELAQGEYILFLNSDDWYTADAVEALVKAKDYSGCDFVSALALYVNEKTGEKNVLRTMPFNHSQLLRMSLRHETMLIPAAVYDRVGPYDIAYKIIADLEFTRRLFKEGLSHYEVPRPLLNFRTSGVSNTNLDLLRNESERFLVSEFPFLSTEKAKQFADAASARPEMFVNAANAHLDQPEFVKACRALLTDRKANSGKIWQDVDIGVIASEAARDYPKISVIMPFFRNERQIRTSIQSVLNQSLEEIELICVNDCSIDGSQSIVDEYRRQDSRVKLMENETNSGPGQSRNAGVKAARGRYIFFLDADDEIPAHALKKLYEAAAVHGSDLVRGAVMASQGVLGKPSAATTVKYPANIKDHKVVNTCLSKTPALLSTTEGHFAHLYNADFVRKVLYPHDLRMGEDSFFLVKALTQAKSITLMPEVVYHYRANPESAMNNFSASKFFDALEWRRRAWCVLKDAGHTDIGENLLFNYWNESFFDSLSKKLTDAEHQRFIDRIGAVLIEAGYPGVAGVKNPELRALFDSAVRSAQRTLSTRRPDASGAPARALRVATFCAWDNGGAGTGSQRRVEALRRNGLDVEIHCLFKKMQKAHVRRVPLGAPLGDNLGETALNEAWRSRAVATREEYPFLNAQELFSKTGSIVNFDDLRPVFNAADIVHLHWVVGMFDYDKAPEHLGGKPVVWTLADMNAFTGGCHYSEGCNEYRNECRHCPLLPGSDLAHQSWKTKRKAYDGMNNLHIVCPSQWLAERAAESSLFGDRPIHVIPNAFPIDRFQVTNKMVARQRLGLPLDKKLVIFGAASLSNKRKGGGVLRDSFQRLQSCGALKDVEGLFFGNNSLDIGVKAHNMGYVSDERRLSLIYAAGDVFAFPSREDNAPLTVAEAMLSGTPVVGFPVGNVPELVTHRETGYIARYEDVDDFADGLAWALDQPRSVDALKRSIRCSMAARNYNHPDRSAQAHIALYDSICGR